MVRVTVTVRVRVRVRVKLTVRSRADEGKRNEEADQWARRIGVCGQWEWRIGVCGPMGMENRCLWTNGNGG